MMQALDITQKIWKCRETARRFHGENYQAKVKPYVDTLKHVMKALQLDVLAAVLKVSETELYQESPMTQMMFMAAAVEISDEYARTGDLVSYPQSGQR